MTRLPALLASMLAACAPGGDPGRGAGTGTGTGADAIADADAGAVADADADAGADAATEAGAAVGDVADAQLAALQSARVVALAPLADAAQRAMFDVALEQPDGGRMAARALLVLRSAPTAHRRPLAYWRLSRALGSDAVAPTALRALPIADVARLLDGQAEVLGTLRARAAIANDGTIDALLTVPPPVDGQPVALDGRVEAQAWQRWSVAPEPVAEEQTGLLRAYVTMLVLDYLSANVGRKTVWLDARSGRMVLHDNGTAFPLRAAPRGLDQVLRRLREVARFPRGLRDALAALDRNAAWALFNPGDFDSWLLPPRTLVELDERRAGLLTLVDARISERGADAVLSL